MFGVRLRRARKTKGLTLDAVAQAMKNKYPESGINKGTLSKYENEQQEPMVSTVKKLADVLDVSIDYLTGKSDNMTHSIDIPAGFDPLPRMTKIPLIGEIACGTPILAEQNVEDYIDCPALCKATFALQCHGDSMIGAEIHDGDIVFIQQQPEVENGQIAAVQIDDGDCYNATLKRFYRSGDTVTLMAENPSVAPMVFTRDQINRIHIAGRAVYCLSKIE